MNYSNNKITSFNEAINLLKTHILFSKEIGSSPLFYTLSIDGSIIVMNENRKYHISKDEFQKTFYMYDFYIYKSLEEIKENEVEIDQEFHKLRQ